MTIRGLGVDLVQVARIQTAVQRSGKRFLEKIYLPSEIDEYHTKLQASEASAFQYLASRWAVKEAVYKAVHPHIVGWQDSSVRKLSTGGPELNASPHLQSVLTEIGAKKSFLSISHDGDYSIAHIILEG
eukprot:CFRG6944T1